MSACKVLVYEERFFSSPHERGTKKKFWVPMRNGTSDLRILPSDSLPVSHRDSKVNEVYLTNRFQVAVRLFSNRSKRTSKCGNTCIQDIYGLNIAWYWVFQYAHTVKPLFSVKVIPVTSLFKNPLTCYS